MKKVEWIYGRHAVESYLKIHPENILELRLLQSEARDKQGAIQQLAQQQGIGIQWVSLKSLNGLWPEGVNHQGVAAACRGLPHYTEADLGPLLASQNDHPLLILVLEGLQDPHNLGACLRSANAFGADCVIATQNRSSPLTLTARKVASGAAELTPFVPVVNLARTLDYLQKQGVWIVGTDAASDTMLPEIDLTGHIAVVLGSEGNGLRHLTRRHCDYLARIPMEGAVESLNVSVAAGIALYEAVRQRR